MILFVSFGLFLRSTTETLHFIEIACAYYIFKIEYMLLRSSPWLKISACLLLSFVSLPAINWYFLLVV